MKTLLKFIKSTRKNGTPQRSEVLTPQEKIHEQTLVWKAHVGTNYFTI
ncbi:MULTISPECIES: hypothetical protein [unclassified Treponema]|nr:MULTISPECIES: hypothetical protein [unclassified Treponema]UTC66623.1 hypothetical protein E4O06_11785 [Treponema sp. OMZ 789]UTC69355.1 hypothetical protein E4O01_11925 [Treponema sp. OMZ 790]UTC72070.1 hypothetical protein E4O02_12020 [Treponema sp. OMZ 791]